MNEKLTRMRELVDLLNNASVHYYQYSTPIMTDYEYDRLYDELVELEASLTITNESIALAADQRETALASLKASRPSFTTPFMSVSFTIFLIKSFVSSDSSIS